MAMSPTATQPPMFDGEQIEGLKTRRGGAMDDENG